MYMTSREFNQDLAKAKRESLDNPVIITDRGRPKHVLLNFAEFEELMQLVTPKPQKSLFDCFSEADPQVADIEFEAPVRTDAKRPELGFGEI